jgi:branched-chain amino acid transport system ATP-binding protein
VSRQSGTKNLLEVEGLGIRFGGVKAVDDVSFSVQPGEIVSIIGPNGAGKTTLFNMISGVYTPGAGRVRLEGEDVTGLAPHLLARRGLSRTFQNLQIFQSMSVLDNVMSGFHLTERGFILADLLGWPSARRRARTAERDAMALLERVRLERGAEREAGSLSYGSLKRLEIARALALRPRMLLLDEPAAGCNAVETEEIDRLIEEIAHEGTAILLVEHDMKMVMRISNHIVVLDHGEKIAEGDPAEVSRNDRVIEAYLGAGAKKDGAKKDSGTHKAESNDAGH